MRSSGSDGAGSRRAALCILVPARIPLLLGTVKRTFTVVPAPAEGTMPVTAKLSRKFYERFGDEIANELVEWFNAVDATYRADLRELNELNFARSDAKLEQRLAELDARCERRIAEVRVELKTLEGRLVRWMLAFWTGTVVTIVGTVVGAVVVLQRL